MLYQLLKKENWNTSHPLRSVNAKDHRDNVALRLRSAPVSSTVANAIGWSIPTEN